MNHEEPKNETEALSEEDAKLHRMLNSLKRFEAPKDFDFRLKARIANARPEDFRPRSATAWAFRYALPVLAIALLFSAFAYNGGFWTSTENQPVAENSGNTANKTVLPENLATTVAGSPTPENSNDENLIAPKQDLPKVDESTVAENNPKNSKVRKIREREDDSVTNSEDKSIRPPIVKQPNSNSNIVPQMPNNFINSNPIPIKEGLFQIMGIEAVLENGKWAVKSLTPNGMAALSGIRVADVIEAIDNQTVSPESSFVKTFSGQTVTVLRNGEKIKIKLQNK